MNLCHNRYGKNAEFMVKCQQVLEFMHICRISVLMSLYQHPISSQKDIFSHSLVFHLQYPMIFI